MNDIVSEDTCKVCGKELEEVMGDGPNFEWDVIGYKPHQHTLDETYPEDPEEEIANFKENELQICITLNGSELCRPYRFENLEDVDPEKWATEVTDILKTLQDNDK